MTRPRLQLALDTRDIESALRAAMAAADLVDIIEAGTVLCLNTGMAGVRALRAALPAKALVADVRLARAGEKFARIVFQAGADRVTIVGEAPEEVLVGALAAASKFRAAVEVELGPRWSLDDVARWVELGVSGVIVHRPAGVAASDDTDSRKALDQLATLNLDGANVILAGGFAPGDLAAFSAQRFDVLAVGSAIVASDDPHRAAAAFVAELEKLG